MLHKHRNNTDVAIEILRGFYVAETRVWKLTVRWWNIGPHKPFCMGIEERLDIPAEKMAEWEPYLRSLTERSEACGSKEPGG
jgi:hypothetical protein